jgi:hypothetical protein
MSHGMWHAPQEIRMRDSCISVAYAAALICLLMVLVFSLAWSHEQPLDDHSSWSVNPSNLSIAKPAAMMCARGLLNGRTCCRASCGTCGGAGCRYRLGGARMCCPAAIAAAGRVCEAAGEVGCNLAGGRFDEACAFGVHNSGDSERGSSASGKLVPDVCCAASCGICSDDPGCGERPGGRSACCPQVIRENAQRCQRVQDTVCSFTQWRNEMARTIIAWGVYGRGCSEIEAFSKACIGCTERNTYGLALLDAPKVDSSATASYSSWRCAGTTHTFLVEQVLVYRKPNSSTPASDLRYWPRTQALLKQLTTTIPHATFYVKLDTDTFLNVQRLRTALLSGLSFGDASAPDYIGKPLRIFSFKGLNITHMQGGGYVLSRRAAVAAATCELGSWRECPSSVFRDMNNKNADRMIRQRCDWPATNAEDLMTGVCMHMARMKPHSHPCMLTLRAATAHRRQRPPAASPSQVLSAAAAPLPSYGGGGQASDISSFLDVALNISMEARALVNASGSATLKVIDPRSNPDNIALLQKLRTHPRCPCSITAHPLKGDGVLMMAREAAFEKGCAIDASWPLPPPARQQQQATRATDVIAGKRSGKRGGGARSGGGRASKRGRGSADVATPAGLSLADEMRAFALSREQPDERQLVRPQDFGSSAELLTELSGGATSLTKSSDGPVIESSSVSELAALMRESSSSGGLGGHGGGSALTRHVEADTTQAAHAAATWELQGLANAQRPDGSAVEAAAISTRAEHAASKRLQKQVAATPVVLAQSDTMTQSGMSWTRHANRNCYPGMGAVHLGQSRVGGAGAANDLQRASAEVLACFQRCLKFLGEVGSQCDSVTLLARPRRRSKKEKRGANCFYRRRTTPDLCAQDVRFDTYTRVARRE